MKNILIPTDLTDCTQNTLKYAISLSVKSKTKLFFYHANATKEPDIKEYALKFIKDIFNELNLNFENAQTEFIIEDGHFSNAQIKSAIEKYNIDLVIMGASHEGLKTTFFGSHVSELINEVSCPVLSIPHGYTDTNIDRIGYASELYDLSERVKEIVPFARLFDASIEAFHVYPVFPQTIDVEKYDVKNALSQLHKENNYDKINLHFIKTPLDNEPVTGIRQFIKSYKPDMLVMCHSPRGLFDKLLMDTGATTAVVKTSSIPILALNQKTACKLM
jgi:nucleotide-binding universal stress UspA family protein